MPYVEKLKIAHGSLWGNVKFYDSNLQTYGKIKVLQVYIKELTMAKSDVQVMLTKDISKVGKVGDLLKVAPGYARNYLLPQGMAVLATPGVIKEVERRKEKERQRQLAIRQEAERCRDALAAIGGYSIKKQVGEGNAIFGSVTDREVADLIKEKANIEIDRREITVPEIRKTGTYEISIKLHTEVTATIKLQVQPE